MRKIFIISGPAGAGKSTTARKLAERLAQSAYIEGDAVNHMVVGGYKPPWRSKEALSLIWKNIAGLSLNFLTANKQVVVDYVAFPVDVAAFAESIRKDIGEVEVRYTVLWTDEAELLRRDALRPEEEQMGKRCLELAKEFREKEVEERFFLCTTDKEPADFEDILTEIEEKARFIYEGSF